MPLSTAQKLNLLLGSGSYTSRVLSTGPVALWPLSETSGSVAADASGNGYNGTYSAVTLNNATFGDGTPAPLFVPASSSHVATHSAGLVAALNVQEGTMACWLRMSAAGVWADGQSRFVYDIFADTSNRIRINKNSPANQLFIAHQAGGATRAPAIATISVTRWFHAAITWSTAGAAVYGYLDGVQSANAGAPGTFAGAINNTSMAIGSFITGSAATLRWDGNIKYMGLWNRALTPGEIANLYVPGYAV